MNTDDRALADLIAELRGLLAEASKRPWARCYPSVDRIVTGGTLWCGQNRDADEALIVATVNALPTLLDRLEAFHAKPVVGKVIEVKRGWANSHMFDDIILSDGEAVAFASEPWTTRISAALQSPPPVVSGEASRVTPEWCLKMAELEGDAEIGAGRLDHPLRCPSAASWEVQYVRESDGSLRAVQSDAISYEERVEYEERILAVEMENERLKRALRPFAVKCILWNEKDRLYARDSQQVQHRLGDFRAAHKVIFGDVA